MRGEPLLGNFHLKAALGAVALLACKEEDPGPARLTAAEAKAMRASNPGEGDEDEDLNLKVDVPSAGADPEGTTLFCPERTSPLVDNMWYAFDDRDVAGGDRCPEFGTSESRLYTVQGLTRGGPCVVGWTGRVTNSYRHGFAGVAVESAKRDWSGQTGFVLATKGDGRKYRVEVGMGKQLNRSQGPDCDNDAYDFYGTTFVCGDGKGGEKEMVVNFADLRQNGWGQKMTLDTSDIHKLQVRTIGAPIDSFQCEYWIKEFIK
jgi:Complex I intermediate-associated protein 30 (CIA30)